MSSPLIVDSCTQFASSGSTSQARLVPGRIHHCMRSIGVAERALEYMCKRALERETFGKPVAQQGLIQDWIAEARIEIDQSREYALHVAHLMDTIARRELRRHDPDFRMS